ncbi:DUF2252 family protein [Paenibacillus amylolyticus]|uniref:S-layer domain protein n=1 Tax=Paenibacillus amylolyticus TaxID=1451 RepID=A0A100VL94_PAEAM|nr:DUF2252 family protein [Paenibacillus amylolyticus]GAS81819.1 S-layer domain protein [Paenibacillus amylolyticus]
MRIYGQRWLAIILVMVMIVQSAWSFIGIQIAGAASYETGHLAKNVVISQFYGGKKDDVEDTYSNDFVELHNPTGEEISLTGWSIQYADSQKSKWKKVDLGTVNHSIPAYGYYLISLDSNGAVGAALPQADEQSSAIKLSNKSGKIVLLRTDSTLTVMDPTTDPLNADIVDFVGYGADAYWGTPASESGKQSTMQRLVFDPLNPDQPATATMFPDRGNNWDTRDNGRDFEKVKGAPVRNSGNTAAYVILEQEQTIQMQSESMVSNDANKVMLTAVGGKLKQGPWSSSEFNVLGLPNGIFAEAAANGDQIQLTFNGDGTGRVLAESELFFEIHPEAWNQINKPSSTLNVYQGSHRVTIAKFTPDHQIVASPDSNSAFIHMTGSHDMSTKVRIEVSQGLPIDGILASEAYTLTGLPSGNWELAAVGESADRSVTISIEGQSDTPVSEQIKLNIVLNPEAIQDGNEWLASEAMELTLGRYIKPVLTDIARKDWVEKSIIADNTFFNDPVTKEYKYGTEGLAANEYTFLRGTNALFKADLASGLITSPAEVIKDWANKDILTYTEGDAHIQNVGTFNDSTKQMVFGLNDFDTAGIGSFYEELLRFVTSVYILPYDKDSSGIQHLQTSDYRDVSRVFLETYKDTLVDIQNNKGLKGTKLTASNVTDYTKAVMNSVSKKSYEEALEKLLGKRTLNGKLNIAGNPDKFEKATEAELSALQSGWEAYKAEVRHHFPNLTDEQFEDYFTMKDAVRRINQGVGSIGVKRFNVLIEGASDNHTDDILLDVKEQTPDASESKNAYLNMGVDVDTYLGTLVAAQRSYLIREVSPFKGDYTDKTFQSKEELQQYLIDAAKSYAYASSRLDSISDTLNYAYEDRFVSDIIPIWDALVPAILNAAEDYSQQIVTDFNLVKEDMRSGKLIDVATLDNLTVSQGTMEPSFNPETTQYRVTVDANTESIDITAKSTDAKAALTAKGSSYANAHSQTFALSSGQNQIPFVVTARNGLTRSYNLTVLRGALTQPTPSNPSGGGGSAGSSGTNGNSGTPSNTNQLIPAGGGEFAFQGVTLRVPNGALQASTTMDITKVPDAASLLTGTPYQLLGDVFQANSKMFLTPVTVTLPFDQTKVSPNQEIRLYGYNEANKQWEPFNEVKVDREKGTISGSTSYLGTFAILLSAGHGISLPETSLTFSDIQTHWGAANILELVSLGVINGYPDQSFRPDRNVSRAELISLIVKALKLETSTESDFTDTDAHWAHDAINTAHALGIANGYSDNRFGPNEWVTREEMATFVVRAAQWEISDTSISFTDASLVSNWAQPAISKAIAEGILNGYTDGSFKPKDKTTRAEAAAMILRLIKLQP